MKVIKHNVTEDDKRLALDILNRLRMGDRVFGSPAQGLKKTLLKLDNEKPESDTFDNVTWNLKDSEYEGEIAKLKKGIEGEKTLAEYFQKIIRLDNSLNNLIVFASLGDETTEKDYIPDTDFLCVYGNNLLVVDAKAISTNPEIPLFVKGNAIYTALNHDVPILEVNSSKEVWEEKTKEFTPQIDGCICIINKAGSEIFKDEEWETSFIKPIHISELVDFLHEWIKDKSPVFDLALLVTIAKTQIQEEKSNLDLTYAKRMFGV